MKNPLRLTLLLSAALSPLFAHCDTVDGPVAVAARKALETGDLKIVLPWIKPAGEPEIAAAFAQARSVRIQGGAARDLADRYFLETVVRVHRGGEGAPYTGLKPAGQDVSPAIAAADKAVEKGSAEALADSLAARVRTAVLQSFDAVKRSSTYAPGNVDAGRRFVGAYVGFIHLADRIETASAPSPEHSHEH